MALLDTDAVVDIESVGCLFTSRYVEISQFSLSNLGET